MIKNKRIIFKSISLLKLKKKFECNFVTDGDGRKGYASEAPYNAIHVGAAGAEVPKAVIK